MIDLTTILVDAVAYFLDGQSDDPEELVSTIREALIETYGCDHFTLPINN